MHWEAVLVSCRHLVKFLFYTHFSTVNRIFEGSFLSNHLGLCRASLKPWLAKNLVSFLAWVKSLACRQLPLNSYRGLYSKIVQCGVVTKIGHWVKGVFSKPSGKYIVGQNLCFLR